ncbi:YqgQ family protein [Limosilactobacillus difficilis]|uniref:YqgQ family protein n=1 Tax=Limosilactobacillus difficilis TaxID=2991838 RepID=UPI0024BAE405|nr:YqgQ family protein [Limosilactobacillus difficilis]
MQSNNNYLKTYYDVLQLLKRFDVFIYVGRRLWDIELAALEVDNLYQAGVIDRQTYLQAKLVLRREHREQAEYDLKHRKGTNKDEQ